MDNPILLNTLYIEWAEEMAEKTLRIRAIEHVKQLLINELPKEEK